MDDSDQLERIRAKAYAIAEGGGPNADQALRILSKLPKIKVGQDIEHGPGMPKQITSGELSSGRDFGAELPPTPDEQVGLPNDLAKPGLGTRLVSGVLDPHKRREVERGLSDMVTLGGAEKIAGLAEKVSPTPGEGGFTPGGSALDRNRAPGYREGGQLVGSVIPGATSTISRFAGGLTAPLVKPLVNSGVAGNVFGNMLSNAAANTLAMPAIAGGQAAVRGENPLPVMREEIQNPVNPLVGAAVGIPVGAARGIRGSNTQTGRDIRLVENYGARPSPVGGAHGGIFDAPMMQGAEGSTREAGSLARRASREVLGGLQGEKSQLSKDYGSAKAAAGDAGFLEGRIDPLYVREEAERLMKGERVTNAQRQAIQSEVMDAIDRHPTGMTLDDFNDFRGKLGDIFGVGPGQAAHPALDKLRQAAKRTVDETEMGPINEAYSKGTESLNKKYDQLKLTPDTNPRVAEERLAGEILRRGENTPTAGIQEPAIDEFLAANPQYKPLFDSVSLMNAKERMGAGLQAHGGTLYTRMHGALHHNLEPIAVGAYRLGQGMDDKTVAATLAARLMLGMGTQ